MLGAIPLLPQYAYMAWCSVKAQGQLYLYLWGETVAYRRDSTNDKLVFSSYMCCLMHL
jgi:hypothetical protein